MIGAAQRRVAVLGIALACILIGSAVAAPAVNAKVGELNTKGVDHYHAKRWDAAIAAFREAYRLAPDHAAISANLSNALQAKANVLYEASDVASAVAHLEEALRVTPDASRLHLHLGACYLRLDRVADAIRHIETAVEREPGVPEAHDLLGQAYYRDGDAASALAQWEWVIEVKPDRPGLAERIEKARREADVEATYNRRDSRHFQVSYAPDTSYADMRRALTILERAYTEVGRRFGGVYPPGPIQVRVYTADDFSRVTLLGEHVGAVYDGAIRLPLSDKTGQVLDEAELKRRLYHEYTHVVVRHIVGDDVPWWLNEGLAETVSTELMPRDVERLEQAYRSDAAFSIAELQEHQLLRLPPESLQIAYLQAHAAVRHLHARYGQTRLNQLLTALANGTAHDAALRQAYRRTYAQLDDELRKQYAPGRRRR